MTNTHLAVHTNHSQLRLAYICFLLRECFESLLVLSYLSLLESDVGVKLCGFYMCVSCFRCRLSKQLTWITGGGHVPGSTCFVNTEEIEGNMRNDEILIRSDNYVAVFTVLSMDT